MQKISVFLFLILLSGLSIGSTIVECNNPEYANNKLNFFSYTDPITKDSEFLFSLEFDENGKSSVEINISESVYVFCDFGIYRGMLFLESNKITELKLPPHKEKGFADQKNPYFSPLLFWFKTENQLNNQVSEFTQRFNQLTDKYFNQLYFRQSKAIYDSLLYYIEQDFGDIKSDVFVSHKSMKLKMVEVEAFRLKSNQFAEMFSSIQQQFWLHPAFIDIFDKAFSEQLSFEVKSINGKKIGSSVNNGDVLNLQKFIKANYNISGEIADLVLLKMLHDGFYSGDFSKSAIKEIVELSVFQKHTNTIIRKAAANIIAKFSHLQQGTVAPVICLKNIQGEAVCTNSKKDKFKYIIFADIEMIICREHLKYLVEIDKRFNKNLEIFVVLKNTGHSGIQKFLEEKEIPGTILIDEKGEFIGKYKLRTFPQSFLLNEKHLVQFVSTKTPLDGFEQQFSTFLRNELFMRQRNQSR